MERSVINKLLAAVLLIAAYYVFDPSDVTQSGVAAVLTLSAADALLRDSASSARRELGRACLRLAGIIAVFLVVKIVLIG